METKVCYTCKVEKEINNFYKNKKSRERNCKQCRYIISKSRYRLNCSQCKEEFNSDKKLQEFCSAQCRGESQKKSRIESCAICSKEVIRPQSRYNGKHYVYCSYKCKSVGDSRFFSGENSHAYNHDKPLEERLVERKYVEYYDWRRKVYERDKYTCQSCGDNNGGNLVAHHIFNYSEHVDLRTEESNGITLCSSCHLDFHNTYGYRNNNQTQLNKFLKDSKECG